MNKDFDEYTREDILKCMYSDIFHVMFFIYKGQEYEFTGYWGLFKTFENKESELIQSYGHREKEQFFTDPLFDEGTKTFLDIVDEIELVSLDLDMDPNDYPYF